MKIGANAKASAIASIDVKASVNRENSETSTYDKSITNKFITSIGAPMPASLEMKEWLSGSSVQPMPVSYFLEPLHELLQQSVIVERFKSKVDLGITDVELKNIAVNLKLAYHNYCLHLKDVNGAEICKPEGYVKVESKELYTEFVTSKNLSVNDLEGLPVKCGQNSALNYFQFQDGDKNFRYKLRCIKSDNISDSCETKQTTPEEADKAKGYTYSLTYSDFNAVSSLSKHKIQCNKGSLLRSFQVNVEGKKIYFVYECCSAKVSVCLNKKTSPTPVEEKITYLASQEVNADTVNPNDANTKENTHFGLQGFELIHNEAVKTLNYDYVACSIAS
jgi:hypothetical protein